MIQKLYSAWFLNVSRRNVTFFLEIFENWLLKTLLNSDVTIFRVMLRHQALYEKLAPRRYRVPKFVQTNDIFLTLASSVAKFNCGQFDIFWLLLVVPKLKFQNGNIVSRHFIIQIEHNFIPFNCWTFTGVEKKFCLIFLFDENFGNIFFRPISCPARAAKMEINRRQFRRQMLFSNMIRRGAITGMRHLHRNEL